MTKKEFNVTGPPGALDIDFGPGDCCKESLQLPFDMFAHLKHLL